MVVGSDYLHLVEATSSKVEGKNSFHVIVDDIVHGSGMLNTSSCSFVRRDGNRVSHELPHGNIIMAHAHR